VPLSSVDFGWQEKDGKAYLYWLLPKNQQRSWSMALSGELQVEKRDRPEAFTGDENIVTLDTKLVPIGLKVFPVEYLSLKFVSTHVKQTGRLSAGTGFGSLPIDQGFWLSDFSVDYRLPGRVGTLAIGVSNVFNHKNHRVGGYQELDTTNPQFAEERLVFGRFIYNFRN
jgi:hypothetical protein